jgi:hypothetical protein
MTYLISALTLHVMLTVPYSARVEKIRLDQFVCFQTTAPLPQLTRQGGDRYQCQSPPWMIVLYRTVPRLPAEKRYYTIIPRGGIVPVLNSIFWCVHLFGLGLPHNFALPNLPYLSNLALRLGPEPAWRCCTYPVSVPWHSGTIGTQASVPLPPQSTSLPQSSCILPRLALRTRACVTAMSRGGKLAPEVNR